jgi:hypothetical protein
MDTDLEAMRSIERYQSCVECLLEPLLKKRQLAPTPCKHKRTFEIANDNRRTYYEERGSDDPGDDSVEDHRFRYCDCGARFDRRAALWEIGDLCLKHGLWRNQMREMAAILLLITRDHFTYNHVNRAMRDLFQGVYKPYLKAYKRRRDQGASFEETVEGLVPRWQFRMMPNA